MKKFNAKTILLIVLVLMLAFAMVACDKDKEPTPGPTPEPPAQFTPAQYFTDLWDLTTGIGDEQIAETDNVALHADMSVALMLQNGASVTTQSISIGVGLDLVLDRETQTGVNTAIKANLYNPATKESFATVYFFLNDTDNLYVDFGGQHIRIPFVYRNDEIAGGLHSLIFEKVIFGTNTIGDIIGALTSDMGADWSLDSLIDGLVSLTGINLQEMLGKYSSAVEQILGGAKLFNEQGKLNIKGILTSETASNLFPAAQTKRTITGNTTVSTTQIDSDVLGSVGSLLGSMINNLPEGIFGQNGLINKQTAIKLEYAVTGDNFDYFKLSASFGSLTAKDSGGKTVHPVIELAINDLEICKAKANEISIDKPLYTPGYAIDAKTQVSLDGIKLDTGVFGKDLGVVEINNAKLEVGVKGKVDLANVKNNETFANAYIALNGTHVVDLTLANGAIGLKINREAKLGDLSVCDTLVSLFGEQAYNALDGMFTRFGWNKEGLEQFANAFFAAGVEPGTLDKTTINDNFKGAVWKGIDVYGAIKGFVDKLFTKPVTPPVTPDPGATEGVTAATPTSSIVVKVIDTIKLAIPLFTTEPSGITIASNDVMAKVVEIWKQYDKGLYDAANAYDYIIDKIVAMDASNYLQKFAKFFVIDNTSNAGKTDAEIAHDFLVKVFTSLKAELVYKYTNAEGAHFAINVTANKTVKVGVAIDFKVVAFDVNNFVNVAQEYEAAQDKTGWVVYDFTPVEEQA